MLVMGVPGRPESRLYLLVSVKDTRSRRVTATGRSTEVGSARGHLARQTERPRSSRRYIDNFIR